MLSSSVVHRVVAWAQFVWREHRLFSIFGGISSVLCVLGFFSPVGSLGISVAVVMGICFSTRAARVASGRDRRAWAGVASGLGIIVLVFVSLVVASARAGGMPNDGSYWSMTFAVGIFTLAVSFVALLSANFVDTWRRILDVVTVSSGVAAIGWATAMSLPSVDTTVLLGKSDAGTWFVDELALTLGFLNLVLVCVPVVLSRRHWSSPVMIPAVGFLITTVTTFGLIALVVFTGMKDFAPLSVGLVAGYLAVSYSAARYQPCVKPKAKRLGHQPYLPHALLVVGALVASVQRMLYPEYDIFLTSLVGTMVVLVVIRSHMMTAYTNRLVSKLGDQEVRLRRQALEDDLTSLDNRRRFTQVVSGQVACVPQVPTSIAYLDMDGFKTINDTFGHAGGDHVLQEVARRLRSVLPGALSIARISGDEFAVLLPPAAGSDESAARILEVFATPVELGRESVVISGSVGVAVWEPGMPPVRAEFLIRCADVALYEAKKSGRGRYLVVDADGTEVDPTSLKRLREHTAFSEADLAGDSPASRHFG